MKPVLKVVRDLPDRIEYDVVRDGSIWGGVLFSKKDGTYFVHSGGKTTVHFKSKFVNSEKAALAYVQSKTAKYRNLANMSAADIMTMEGSMKLMKILEDINVPLKKGDTVLVGKFKNHPVTVKSIGRGDDKMPTINDKPAVKFRLPKKVKKEGKLTEMPHGHSDKGAFDLQIEKYPLPQQQRQSLLRAYNSDAGVWGYSSKYDRVIIFKRTGVIMSPKGGVAQTQPATSAKPQSIDGSVPTGNNNNKLPQNWEKFVIGKY